MAHEIVWTAAAEADLLSLYEQFGDHDLAIRVLRQPLMHALNLLADHPGLGAKIQKRRLRRLLVGPKRRFGLFYAEEGKRVMLLAILDMRQDPEWLARRMREL